MKVPFTKPCVLGSELKNIELLIQSGASLAGGGQYNKFCESFLTDKLKTSTLLTTSGTHSLELSALLAQIKPGDEILIPSFTFVSSINAFILRGAHPRFVDSDEYGNIDLDDLERNLNSKSKAVCVVHYASHSCDMDRLLDICSRKKLTLIEDAAQAVFSKYKNRYLGTFGEFGCYSFHDTKNFTSGEGGALIVRTKEHLERAEILREKGTNRTQFFQGLVDKYTWVDVGSSYVLSELNAAYLYPQLQAHEAITAKRKSLWNRYRTELTTTIDKIKAQVLDIPFWNTSNYHTFGIIFKNLESRKSFIDFMKAKTITTPFHYVALHTSPFGKQYLSGNEKLEGCLRLSDGLVRLPLYYNMTDDEQTYVIDALKEYSLRF